MSVSNPQSPTPPLHAEVRAAVKTVLVEELAIPESDVPDLAVDAILQAVADALLSEAKAKHITVQSPEFQQITDLPLTDIYNSGVDAVTRVIGELRGSNPIGEKNGDSK